MIAGRSPRGPVIGDIVLLRFDSRHGPGTIVDADAVRYKLYWRNGKGANCPGTPAPSWPSRESTSDGNGRDVPAATKCARPLHVRLPCRHVVEIPHR
jgi:hypothetical protein